jgi:hypothetical protein
MKDARTLAAAALTAFLACTVLTETAQGQTERTQGQTEAAPIGAGQDGASKAGAATGLAPDQAVTPAERPAERPAEPPLAPAGGAPAPAPRPGEVDSGEGTAGAHPGARTGAEPGARSAKEPAPETAPKTTPETAPAEAPARSPTPGQAPGAPGVSPAPAEDPEDEGAAAPVPAEPAVPERLAEDDAGLAACLGRLGALGTVFERVDPVSEEGGACGIANPLRVSEIVPGVALDPAGVMRCATAVALADWVATFVLPASRLLPERGPLAAVNHASAYVCRRIGGAGAGGDFSQHAYGNALDVSAFRFAEGDAIPVEPRQSEGTAAEAFQRTARASACLLFTTVLGPGQEDHDDHLHLDIVARDSGYRLCQ